MTGEMNCEIVRGKIKGKVDSAHVLKICGVVEVKLHLLISVSDWGRMCVERRIIREMKVR